MDSTATDRLPSTTDERMMSMSDGEYTGENYVIGEPHNRPVHEKVSTVCEDTPVTRRGGVLKSLLPL